ncbi:MAG: hypothetical protein JO250_12595 [Armatimonadetes bacterium]|nr:hypothetical protein [Armatimonadota bacterium]
MPQIRYMISTGGASTDNPISNPFQGTSGWGSGPPVPLGGQEFLLAAAGKHRPVMWPARDNDVSLVLRVRTIPWTLPSVR